MLDTDEIQGLIVSGYPKHPAACYRFYRFPSPSEGLAGLSALFGSGKLTFAGKKDALKDPKHPIVNLALGWNGMRDLGLDPETLDMFPHELKEGMAHAERAAKLGDTGASAPREWDFGGLKPSGQRQNESPEIEIGGQENMHALCLVYAVETELAAVLKEIDALLAPWNLIHEMRAALPESKREPFGFRDGLSRVPMQGWDDPEEGHVAPVKAGEFILGYGNQFGFLPVSPTVKDNPSAACALQRAANGDWDFGRNGTYLVFRKLRQNVEAFWSYIETEALRFKGEAGMDERKWLAAKLVGRWPNGNSLIHSPDREGVPKPSESADDFRYHDEDPDGRKCPFGSHARRSNPRDGLAPGPKDSLEETARHRLIRRGRVYWNQGSGNGGPIQVKITEGVAARDGSPAKDPVFDYDEEIMANPAKAREYGPEHGLAFIALNASFRRQFEFIQQSWINNPNFEGLRNNRDPIAGNNSDPVLLDQLKGSHHSPPEDSRMRIPGATAAQTTCPLPRFVTTRGGGYFFLPGKGALAYLVAPHASGSQAALNTLSQGAEA